MAARMMQVERGFRTLNRRLMEAEGEGVGAA